MKHTINGFITYEKSPWHQEPEIGWLPFNPTGMDHNKGVVVSEHAIVVEVPDDFDPNPQKIAELREKQKKAMADFQKLCTDIERQISELTAIQS